MGVVLVFGDVVWTGGWLLSGGPFAWLFGVDLRAAELVVVDFCDFLVVELPNGSVY